MSQTVGFMHLFLLFETTTLSFFFRACDSSSSFNSEQVGSWNGSQGGSAKDRANSGGRFHLWLSKKNDGKQSFDPIQTFTIHQLTLRSDMMGFSDFYEIHGLLLANECCDFYGIMGCFDVPMPIFHNFRDAFNFDWWLIVTVLGLLAPKVARKRMKARISSSSKWFHLCVREGTLGYLKWRIMVQMLGGKSATPWGPLVQKTRGHLQWGRFH